MRQKKKKSLTDPQLQMLDFLLSGAPLLSQRQVSEGAGFDHPQKAIAAVMGLLMKGCLVVNPDYKEGG